MRRSTVSNDDLKGDSQMSKKEMEPSTPESRAEKLAHKQMLRKAFTGTFLKAFSICLAVLLIYSVGYMALVKPAVKQGESDSKNTVSPGVVQNNNNNQNNSTDNSTDNSTPADDNAQPTPSVTELTTSSSQAEILAYFNTAINNVKPNAKTVTLDKETNSRAGDVTGKLPLGISTGMADSVISAFMGDTKASDLPAPATTVDAKNAMFPVENESWSSKLTEADIDSATCSESNGTYTITVKVKEDPLSKDTAHGVGHNGKAFSVIQRGIVMDNVPSIAKGILSDAETGHKDGVITVTVDKATGNVTSANYYFTWLLHVTGSGLDATMVFGLEKHFTIAW